jgi:hypothetical protein
VVGRKYTRQQTTLDESRESPESAGLNGKMREPS